MYEIIYLWKIYFFKNLNLFGNLIKNSNNSNKIQPELKFVLLT